jgi:Tol biopolymer transport system component
VSVRPPLRPILLACCAIIVAACGSGGSAPAPGATSASGAAARPASSGSGSLILSRPEGFAEYDIKSGNERPLVAAPAADAFLLDPTISPDGKQLAYIVQAPRVVTDGTYDSGSDLWLADRDGSNPRAVFVHARQNQLVRFPQWEDDGRVLVIVQEQSNVNGIAKVVYTLERIDMVSGERAPVLEDVLAFALAPDGQRLVYARLRLKTAQTLNAIDIGGGNETVLIPAGQNLNTFNNPRYSPDGKKIAFASADQTGAVARQEYVSLAGGASPAALLDGLPEDIWTIDASGGTPVRVADLKEDLPALTWNGDGKHIYVLGPAGLYDVSVESGAVNRLGEGAFHGQIVWAP